MKTRLLALFGCAAFGTAFAQQATDLATLVDARQARVELAADIAAGRRDPVAALSLLKQRITAQRSPDADLAQGLAAADIGRRLLLSSAPERAGEFFRAADTALSLGINRASNSTTKAQALVQRAQIRSQYLNRKGEAAADMKQAAALLPDDPYIKSWSELLRRRDATALQTQR